jgi:nucleotide-binding universal stress UspA family protein
MPFKSVLTVIADPETARLTIAVAAGMARLQDGHLDVLALGYEASQPGYSYIGAGAVSTDWSLEQAEEDAKAAARAAQAALAEHEVGLRFALETAVTVSGQVSAVVAEKAAFADLVVQAAPQGKLQRDLADAIIEAALFDGNAPVLIIPQGVDVARAISPRRVVLAWNQSSEALNAAKRALPFLQAADVVYVAIIDPPLAGSERSDPGGPLCQYLARHGVTVEVSVLTRSRPRISDVLAQHILDRNADLLVMGAYGHSRLREAVMGGATREVLNTTRVPVLMVH